MKDGKGFIKEYDYYGDLIFEGEYLKGERNGKGKEFENDDIEFIEEEYIFKSDMEYDNCYTYDGIFVNKNKNLIELIIDKYKESDCKLKFEGQYLNGEINGKGKEYYDNGNLKFEGEYLNGERNGKGKIYDNGKLIFEGEFFDG